MERLLGEARRSLTANDLVGCEAACRAMLDRDAQNLDALRLLGVVARQTERLPLSLELLARAVARIESLVQSDARNAECASILHFEQAVSLDAAGRCDDALTSYRRAVQLDPQFFEAHVNLAALLERLYCFREALPVALRAADLNSQSPVALYNLGNVLRELGHIEQATRSYRHALALRPDYASAHMNLSTCLLLLGDFAAGWPEYEWRGPSGEVVIDNYPQPLWRGESLAGKTLLVHAEQGIGDEILFSSCFAEAIQQAGSVILTCEPRLIGLFGRSFPQARVVGWARRSDRTPGTVGEAVDFQIPAGSLPSLLRPTPDSFPQRPNYLVADPQRVAVWRDRFAALGVGPKIGISWRAGGKPGERRRRTTDLLQWRDILTLPGVQFVNLQYGECGDDLETIKQSLGVDVFDHAEGDPLTDLEGFAAKLAALDGVVSVGNATAHLSGALGVPALVLLPLVPAWRWQIQGDSSPWYSSVRLFRQLSEGWDDVLAAVVKQLGRQLNLPTTAPIKVAPPEAKPQLLAAANPALQRTPAAGPLAIVELPGALHTAAAHFERGEYDVADAICRNILLHAPRYFDAQHLLGVVAFKTGRLDVAIRSLRRALATTDEVAQVHLNLGHALRDSGQCDEAAASYQRAVRLEPNSTAALFSLGILQHRQGNHAAAIEHLSRVLELRVESTDVWLYLGHSHRALCQPDEAQHAFRQALRLSPKSAPAHAALGAVLLEDGCVEEAIAALQAATEIEPAVALRQCELGQALHAAGRDVEAQDRYRRACKLDAGYFDAWLRLADSLHHEGRAIEAIDAYRRTAALRPAEPLPMHHLALVLRDLGRLQEARACFDAALSRNPQFAPARFHRSLLMLQHGEFAQGWREYQWRWHCPDGPRSRDYFTQPAWDGSSLAGETLLVHGEQGLGDEVMFASCLPDVIARARRVIVVCQPRLANLFARSFPQTIVHAVPRGNEHLWQPPAEPHVDLQVAAGSLPQFLRSRLSSFPRRKHFLTADAVQVARWRARLAELGPGLNVGISWRAGGNDQERCRRSMPLAAWERILQTPGVHFIDLQYGEHTADLLAVRQLENVAVHRWTDADPLGDADRFAAQIAALDLVISVGNATVHLAGALGVPTWNLLPAHGGWRWPLQGEESPWYASVRILRQPQPHNWQPLLDEVADRLAALVRQQQVRASA